jgi:hypothetical protein
MVEFDLWSQALIFALVFIPIIIIPCVLVCLVGRKMIEELGMRPSQTPIIQMSIFGKLVAIEVVTFALLIGFYQFFTSK